MAAIARNFDAKIIKNTGTSLVYYFPKTSNFCSLSVLRDVIECGIREALMHFEHTDPNTYNLVLMDISTTILQTKDNKFKYQDFICIGS